MKKRLFSRLIFLYQHKKNNPQIDMKGRKNGERSQRSGRAVQVKVREGKGKGKVWYERPISTYSSKRQGKHTQLTRLWLREVKKKERVLWSIHKEEGGNQSSARVTHKDKIKTRGKGRRGKRQTWATRRPQRTQRTHHTTLYYKNKGQGKHAHT